MSSIDLPYNSFPTDPSLLPKNARSCQNPSISQYTLSGFAYGLVPTLLTLVPSRTRRALSISHTTFFQQTPPYPPKMQNPAKNRPYLSISWPDSPMNWFQLYFHWFQVELDELYLFGTQHFLNRPPLTPEKCKILVKSANILVFPATNRLWTYFSRTNIDSR